MTLATERDRPRRDADRGAHRLEDGQPMDLTISRITRGRGLVRSDAMQRLLAFAALIAIIVFFSLASPNFLQLNNVIGILLATSVIGVLALGVTFVIITGGIDLSIGTVMTLSAR